MRVISGTARGKVLQAVPGQGTRPTTARVKESVFNIIQMQVRGAQVLDLFAGTGQMGIEALSRGAAYADFVEQDKTALQVVRKNISSARVEERAQVYACAALTYLQKAKPQSKDVIFLDPPYGGKVLEEILFAIQRFDILQANGIIICESAVDDVWKTPFAVKREYRYGTIKITVLCKEESE